MDEREPLPRLSIAASRLVAEVTKLAESLRGAGHREGRLRVLNEAHERATDALFAANPDRVVACKPGCATCCHQWVYGLRAHELDALHDWAIQNLPREELQDNLQFRERYYQSLLLLHPGEEGVEARSWAYEQAQLPCVFLSAEQTCRVHPIRPEPCRSYFSLATPESCTPAAKAAGTSRNFLVDLGGGWDQALDALDEGRPEEDLVPGLLGRLR